MRIIIVESDTPELEDRARAVRGASNADRFRQAFSAARSGVQCDVFAPYAGEAPDYAGSDGIVFTGSAVEWSVEDARGIPVTRAMEAAFATGLPVWGSCNGMQLAAVLLGGRCRLAPAGVEAGVARDVRLTDAGQTHPMMAGRRDGFGVPCIHRDEVSDLPEGAVLLAGNGHSKVQAFAYEGQGLCFWGTQYHPEYTAASMAAALAARGWPDRAYVADLALADSDPTSAERLGAGRRDLEMVNRTSELRNWLSMIEARADAVLN